MAGPLKVVHCVAGNLYGGVETFLRTLADCRDLTPRLTQEFAVCFEGRLAEELRETGATVHMLGNVRVSRPWTVWRARRRLSAVLANRRIDVVVNHACWPHLLCGPVAKRAGKPVVFWSHNVITEPDDWIWVERKAVKCVPDLALANSRVTAASLTRLYPDIPTEVIHCPVQARDVDRAEARAAVRAETATAPGDVVIVMASRLESLKGHALLLKALARLKDRPGWTAWIAGGAQRSEERVLLDDLKNLARAEGIGERVRWLGPRNDVPRVLAAADLHCQPNVGPESFGIAFVEALYAGLPVVTTRIGGAVEIITESCGRLVPPGDPVALAETLALLIDDPALRTRLRGHGPARASALCAPESVLPELERILLGLGESPPKSRSATERQERPEPDRHVSSGTEISILDS